MPHIKPLLESSGTILKEVMRIKYLSPRSQGFMRKGYPSQDLMKKKNSKLKPDESYQVIAINDGGPGSNARARKSPWITALAFMAVLTSALLFSCVSASKDTKDPQETSQDTITAERTKELRSAVTFPLASYSPTMSSVPGLPLRIEFPDSWMEAGDEVIVTCGNGMVLSWNPPDYVVDEQGKYFKLSSSSTIYWSPVTSKKMIADDVLTIVLNMKSKEIGRIEVMIKANAEGLYSAEMK